MPDFWPDTPLLREDFAAYLGEIQRLDGQVGKVLEDLRKRGLEDNTLIVFIGDNGGALLRGKGTLHRLGLNVPLIVRYPKLVRQGLISDALVSGEDLAPTLLDVAGVTITGNITGRSLRPTFQDEKAEIRTYAYAVRGAHGGFGIFRAGLSCHCCQRDQISTPATHHAHHADTTDDGVGYYKGNFGNMFFIWDLIFGTGIITRSRTI